MILILNFLWIGFAETNERRFDLLLYILITHRLSVTRPRYCRKDLGVDGGAVDSTDHDSWWGPVV